MEGLTTNISNSGNSKRKKHLMTERNPNDFYFIKILGQGSFSTVYLGKEVETGNEYAIKVVKKATIIREKKAKNIMREKDIMIMLTLRANDCPLITTLYSTFQDNKNVYFAMDYAKNGELFKYLQKLGCLDQKTTQFYSAEILLGLKFLHTNNVIHRDLKPENILLSNNWHVLLADFGSARILGDQDVINGNNNIKLEPEPVISDRSSFVGTAQYISPEVITGSCFGPETDYWALGAIIYQMVSGNAPFKAVNEYNTLKLIKTLSYDFPQGFPDTSQDIVKKLLVLKPSERLGSQETGGIEALQSHPFFDGIDWENLTKLTPPELKPYLPASAGEPAFYSDVYCNSTDISPGLNDAQMAKLICFNEFLQDWQNEQNDTTLERNEKYDNNVENVVDKPKINKKTLFARCEEEYDMMIQKQRLEHKYHRFVEDNLILKSGIIDKKKGLFARRRMFLLTEGPHLYYVDPQTMEFKGEIPWSKDIQTEAKNFKTFFVHTPNRTYYLFDPEKKAEEWCQAIEAVKAKYYG
uniref:3-phosphoinositide-dependent protein kinase 1 n=1 Tax=Strongyloides stercoralis TaxID=6248 RepID=A0A0K0DT08_STRER|nr:3-phosphoinositide-dependent kinase [Strongyloides stercoralis]